MIVVGDERNTDAVRHGKSETVNERPRAVKRNKAVQKKKFDLERE